MSAPPSTAPPRPRRPRPGSASAAPTPSKSGERLAKRIARAGLCSRREAEAWIRAGRVAVDGQVVETPALDVTGEQRITVDGRPLPEPEPTRLFRWHKPRGVVTSARDPEGRPTYLERLPTTLPRLMPIGRLDIDSEGLLLLTNDGELKRRLELPSTGWTRRYRVRAFGTVDDAALARLRDGLTVNGIAYGPIEARLDKVQGANVWLTLALKEGKNREVRRVLEHLGLKVNRLIRIAYGPFQLGNLPKNAIEEVPRKVLREQLGTAAFERGRRRPASAGAGRTPAP
ncbi:MAG: rRNA pseudouridine synthase [Geminicoccaceae bacterium]|nr:rRNA pseudouridine synthase [Geminicoccaceae bacterium]